MQNARRLGRGVESRILASTTHSAIVSSRAIAESIGRVSGLLAAAAHRVFRRIRADSRSNDALLDKGRLYGALGAIGEGRMGLRYPPNAP
jgi:hypothetical protein